MRLHTVYYVGSIIRKGQYSCHRVRGQQISGLRLLQTNGGRKSTAKRVTSKPFVEKEALDEPTNQFHSRVNASRTREASETKQRSDMDSRIVLVERLLRERNSIIESE